jgi:hypothetical protein
MSSKRQGLASRLLTVLGGAGLAISICAARANAQAAPVPPWTSANYANRYVCNVLSITSVSPPTATQTQFTGLMKLNPNGKGTFQGGTLRVPLSPFGVTPAGNPTANFCTYTLDSTSIYTVAQDGTGAEKLVWDATSPPVSTSCPASFAMTASFVLRNNVTANNTVPRLDMVFGNFLGFQGTGTPPATVNESGTGYCLK